MSEDTFEGWVILELMGHRRLGGYLTEQEIGGVDFLRLEIPAVDGLPPATQFYGAAAVYCITPTTEEVARLCARANRAAPIHRWELPAAKAEDLDPEEHIRALQDSLRSHGFDPGLSDGVYGPKTAAALQRFQERRFLEIDPQSAITGEEEG
jgi:peptidoglycan hydrolase-like protein with peptidoglycan-binding domain